MHSNECSKYMCIMEQNNNIHYNLYTHINVQPRVTIFNIYREYMYIWNMYWWNSNVETITEIKFCSSFNLCKGKKPYIKSSVTSREKLNVIVRETKSTLQILCTDIFGWYYFVERNGTKRNETKRNGMIWFLALVITIGISLF
jgi:hypothetical protein